MTTPDPYLDLEHHNFVYYARADTLSSLDKLPIQDSLHRRLTSDRGWPFDSLNQLYT